MPKDKVEKTEEPKKKMVVVEEVVETTDIPEEIKTETKPEEKITSNTQSPEEESEKTNYLWIIIPTALLIGALVGGLITYFSGLSKLNDIVATPSPIATIAPEATATATPVPTTETKRSEIKLQVLNGSGVSGLAGKAKTYLEGLGYEGVVVGNASVSNLTETTISVKESKKDLLEAVSTDLAKNYKVAKEAETLVASSKYDFVITLGSK